jgi:hypothetical protein
LDNEYFECCSEGTSSKKTGEEDDISGVCLADMMEFVNFEQGKRSKKV